MSLLQEWREYAYSEEMQNSKEGEQLWNNYFQLEKGIYEKLLTNPTEVVTGTVEGLAEKYEVPLSMMVQSIRWKKIPRSNWILTAKNCIIIW